MLPLGYASYRDPDRGSWFVQEFVEVFQEQANEEHVMDMLTEVRTYVLDMHQSSQYFDCKIWDSLKNAICYVCMFIIYNEIYQKGTLYGSC